MSKRHRAGDQAGAPPRQEQRAHARSERHRVNTELAEVAEQVSGGVEPDDVVEPGVGWRPERRRDPAKVKAPTKKQRRRRRHWKLKMWKRRSAARRAKAIAEKQPTAVETLEDGSEELAEA
jgi:hypothetical protein